MRMKKQLLLITCILALAACEKDIAPENPCDGQQATSAAFTIKEATYTQIIEPRLADFLMDTDSVYFRSVYFEATQANADSFIWQIGTEPEPRYGKQVNVVFPDVLRGTTFTIQLIVKRNPNTQCFPNDDGIDTVMRQFYFVRFNEPLSWEGTYYGSDADKSDSMYTIVLGHSYNVNKKEDVLSVFGVPRGCKDTINELLGDFGGGFVGYKNILFNRNGTDCNAKIVRGIFKNDINYTIRQEYITFVNGVFTRTNRTFTGIKIN
jgi:hypothetical protein